MRVFLVLFFCALAQAQPPQVFQEPAPLNPHTFQPYALPPARTAPAPTGACPANVNLPTPTGPLLRELADIVGSAAGFYGQGETARLASEALGKYASDSRYAPYVTQALLTALERAGGVEGFGDRGELMRMLGVTAAFLPQDSPIFRRAEGELRKALELASTASAVRDAVLDVNSDHPAAHLVRSAAAGWEALALAGKIKPAQMKFLAGIPVPEVANALATAMETADPAERREALQEFFKTAAAPAFSRVRAMALKAMAKYIDRPMVGELITAFDASITAYRRDPQSFDPNTLGILQVVETVAAQPEVRALADAAISRYGLKGPRGKEAMESLVSHARVQLGKDREKAQADLEKAESEIKEIGVEVLLDIAGAFDPTPICDGISCVMAVRRGDYLSATLSAVSMLPYVGDGILKPLKLGGAAAKVMKIAQKAERIISQMSRIQQRIEQIRAVAEYGVDAVDSLSRGELPPADDSLALLARMTLGRKRMASISNTLRTIQSVRDDVQRVQNGECPTRAAGFVNRLQRTMMKPFDWMTKKTPDPIRPFIARGQMPEPAGPLTLDARMLTMSLEPAAQQWVRLKVSQLKEPSEREIVDILLQAKYPSS